MAGISSTGAKGTITGDTTAITLMIDDMSTVEDSGITTEHTAGIVGNGSITVSFAPKAGADATVRENGIVMVATIEINKTGSRQWNNKDILSVSDTDNTIVLNNGVACLSTTVDAEAIIEKLIFCEGDTVVLDEKKDYEDFQAALSDYQIKILISEAI